MFMQLFVFFFLKLSCATFKLIHNRFVTEHLIHNVMLVYVMFVPAKSFFEHKS